MKYILIVTGALLVCFAISFVLARLLTKNAKKHRVLKSGFLTVLVGLILLVATTLAYMSVSYGALDTALTAMKGNETVTVEKVDGGYFFDGPGNNTALVFYPGAKVECQGYAPLMLQLAENGIDCFLADMPFSFSIFGMNMADKFIDEYDYKKWVMAGHSLGGVVAADYAINHSDSVEGIVLLASYSSKEVSDDIKLVTIYGSEDGCLNIEEYNKNKVNWPKNTVEYIIEGGNHCQFGDYGWQDGDGVAYISASQQWFFTTKYICDYFNK